MGLRQNGIKNRLNILCTFGKLIFQGIRNTMLPRLKMSLSVVTTLLYRGTLLEIWNFWKIFIVYYTKTYPYIQALSTTFLLYMKARKLK